jgi:hypothetical protein
MSAVLKTTRSDDFSRNREILIQENIGWIHMLERLSRNINLALSQLRICQKISFANTEELKNLDRELLDLQSKIN